MSSGQGVDAGRRAAGVTLRYMPALDGLRALAVAAVLAYHADLSWARGGFLGVDVFFVLSGFLVTSLLLADRQRHGQVRLARFWFRRARRLFPALAVVLAAVAVAVPLLAPDQGYRLQGDMKAALAYVSNWRLVFEHQSYFQSMGRPPLLQHLWSLAVEEQFYLLWPLVVALGLRFTGRRRRVGAFALGLAVASSVLMAILYDPAHDPSRVYYGTDTRLAALLVGAAVACLWPRRSDNAAGRRVPRAVVEIAGLAGLAGLAYSLTSVHQYQPRLYRGGFLGVAGLAALVVAIGAARRPTLVGSLLALRPLVWLGRRSYAVYLWFWPVFMLTRPYADVPFGGWPLLVLRVAITLALAAASFRFVEEPIRRGALSQLRIRIRRPIVWPGREAVVWGLAASMVIAAIGTGVLIGRQDASATRFVAAAHAEAGLVTPPPPTTEATTTTQVPPPTEPPTTAVAETVTAPAEPPPPEPPAPMATSVIHAHVTAIGESVLLAAKRPLEAAVDGVIVDAAIGRQIPGTIAAARALREQGQLGDAVILQVGNNGPLSSEQFDELMETFSGVGRVVVVNVKVPRPWEGPNNDVIADGVSRTPNAVLANWHDIGATHPNLFADDGVHVGPSGVRLFVDLVTSLL